MFTKNLRNFVNQIIVAKVSLAKKLENLTLISLHFDSFLLFLIIYKSSGAEV